MTAPINRLGCRVLDKDGEDETLNDYGTAEWRALERAEYLAGCLPTWGPFRVVDADGVTLHTIHAALEGM